MQDTSVLLFCTAQPPHIEQVAQTFHLKIENNPDVHVMDVPLTIEATRTMITEMSLRPYQAEESIFILPEIDKASLPAQHALLKSLEEPPAHARIILTTEWVDHVLPTIRSRCVIEKSNQAQNAKSHAQKEESSEIVEILQKIAQGTFASLFEISERYKEREDAVKLIDQIILYLHTQNETEPNAKTTQHIQKCIATKNLLLKNVNVRLALEDLFFSF